VPRKSFVIAATISLLLAGFPSASNAQSLPVCTISGTPQSDRLVGTSGNDVICAGNGNDTIFGLGGSDIIHGGPGNDRISGGDGSDELFGEAGTDFVEGGAGADDISGSDGNDSLFGGLGEDELSAGVGNDTVFGDGGADLIRGDAGADAIQGGTGDDLIDGGAGRDSIRTGVGADNCSSDPSDVFLDACKIDRVAPAIGVNTSDVKNFQAGSTLKLSWSLSDSSGVAQTWASIGGPSGWVTTWCGFGIETPLYSGDAKNGTYQLQCSIPENAVSQTYSLFIGAVDVLGNSTSNNQQITFNIVGGASDSTAPDFSNVRLDSTAKPGGEISLSVSVTDQTGTLGVYGWFMKDGGGFASYPDIGLYVNAKSASELVSGSSTSGVYKQDHKISELAPAGSYTLWLSVSDVLGNRVFVQTDKKLRITN
jgi:Ca2+-binding RTX toxin-like protein